MDAGKSMGICIKAAYEAQLDGAFEDEISANQWLKNYLKTIKNT